MKSKEELNALKEEVEALNKKLAELTEEELEKIHGGFSPHLLWNAFCPNCKALMATGGRGTSPAKNTCPGCGCWVEPNIVYIYNGRQLGM